MSDPSRCPDVPTLQRLLLGQVAVAEADQLEAHFAGCSRCGSTAGGVRAEDTLVEALRGLAAATPAAAREEVHTLIDRLKSLNPQPPVPEPEPTR
jgi:anti-sigma factor RsiW